MGIVASIADSLDKANNEAKAQGIEAMTHTEYIDACVGNGMTSGDYFKVFKQHAERLVNHPRSNDQRGLSMMAKYELVAQLPIKIKIFLII